MQSREKNSSWTAGHPKMGAIDCPETSEANYESTQSKIPRRTKPEMQLYNATIFHETHIRYENSEFGDIFVIFAILPPIMDFCRAEICLESTYCRYLIMHMKQVCEAVRTNTFQQHNFE